jgi:hypothetical protein
VSVPALIPGVLGGDVRRRVPKVSQNKKVPLWTVEPDGQLFQGVIRVPLRLCFTAEHTNERHQFDNLIRANLDRWVEWRRRRGWFINETPRITGPFDPPENDRGNAKSFQARAEKKIGRNGAASALIEFDYAGEVMWYMAEARFAREAPVYTKLEDMLFLRHLALTYGVDPDRDPSLETDLPEAKDELAFKGGLNPLEVAEERRQAHGLKREDYLLGRLEDPL